MAGYSGTPLPQKLGIKPNSRLCLVQPPAGFEATLGALPPGVEPATSMRGSSLFDVILLFTPNRAALTKHFAVAQSRLDPSGGLWIAWPKKASGVPTDLTENVIRDLALAAGLVDNKVCAIDGTWSGLRLVVRLKDRPKTPSPSKSAATTKAPKAAKSPTARRSR